MEGEGNEKSFNRFDLGCASIVRGDCCHLGVLLAGNGNGYWVFFIVLTSVLTFLAITRATKLAE